ncbi:MAG: hypothetical protein OXC10_06795 [Rhodospirillaceae bacterium]|nr:hypothetical protein [Rhodospirillaceae bacterium]
MSESRRYELKDEAFAELDPPVSGLRSRVRRAAVNSAGDDVSWDRSWNFFAYSYSRAFDPLWDAAYSRPSEVLNYPLLFVCRHSIELWLKAAQSSVTREHPRGGHGLQDLWSKLMDALDRHYGNRPDQIDGIDGVFARKARQAIKMLDNHDKVGDRFRYPVKKKFESYASTTADLDELYRAHAIITAYCDAVCTQIEVERNRA